MPAIDCTRSARAKFEIVHRVAFNNISTFFTLDYISYYFHHIHYLKQIIRVQYYFSNRK